jgi:hypothetical protein
MNPMTNKGYRFIAAIRFIMAPKATRCRMNKSATIIQNLSSRHLDVNEVVSAQNKLPVNAIALNTASETQMPVTSVARPINKPRSDMAPKPSFFAL